MVDMLQDAKQVWGKIYETEVIDDFACYDSEPDKAVVSPAIGMHVHMGHMINAFEWNCYMDYLDQYITDSEKGQKIRPDSIGIGRFSFVS